jgi:dihydropteroate synthase
MDATHTWSLPDRSLSLGTRPLIMGIVNVTPDSFSDGGQFLDPKQAVAHALQLIEQGADILDIGGESTRPGSSPVSVEEELRRVAPVIEALAPQIAVPLSIDTSKAEVARHCLQAGAAIVNDVTSLTGDPDMVQVVRDTKAGVILMHMQGNPRTMQINPHYDDVVDDISRYFRQRLQELEGAGIAPAQIVLDPGLGFGKTHEHNLELLARLDEFQQFGLPVCLGVSRKGFIGQVIHRPRDQRVIGSVAIVCRAMVTGAAQIVRVHDVAETRDAVLMLEAIEQFS